MTVTRGIWRWLYGSRVLGGNQSLSVTLLLQLTWRGSSRKVAFPLGDICTELLHDRGQGWRHVAPKCTPAAPLGTDAGADQQNPQALPCASLHVLRLETYFSWLSLPTQVSVSPQPGSSSVSRAGSLLKSMAHPEDKKPETAGFRLERREQLKKANTLPTSVTGSESRTISVWPQLQVSLLGACFISSGVVTPQAVSPPLS